MSSNSLIVKISHGTDMRRFTIDNFNTLNWEMLGKRVADAFGPFKSSFKLTYVDDEGDQITVSSDEELLEAVGLARKATPPVLRLAVGGKKDKKEAPDEQPAKDKTTKDTEAPTKTSVRPRLSISLLGHSISSFRFSSAVAVPQRLRAGKLRKLNRTHQDAIEE